MDTEDYDLILKLSAGCSLDSSPGKNWVERAGGLPNYICKIAKGVMRSGKSKSQAIAIAVSRVKKWASGGGDVDADTKAKAAKALAEWKALKAKNKAKNVIAASYVTSDGVEDQYLMLSYIPSFKTDIVRMAFNAEEQKRRDVARKTHQSDTYTEEGAVNSVDVPYRYVKELWTDFILVETESAAQPALVKIPFTVHPITHKVTFGEEIAVREVYVEMTPELSSNEEALLSDLL